MSTDINHNIESPFELKISFSKLLEHYKQLTESDDEFISAKAKRVLKIEKEVDSVLYPTN